jgi:hypothetical protein
MNGLEGVKNEKQVFYNSIKGVITELNDGEKFCNITLSVGHERKRMVNLVLKKEHFDWVLKNFVIGDKVSATFYITSRNKMGKWYTMASIIDLKKSEPNAEPTTPDYTW